MQTILELERQRRRHLLTQTDVARYLHVSQQAVGQWERERTSPSLSAMKQLGRWWKVDPATLLRKVRVNGHF